MRFLGELSDEELSIAMHTATVHVFPVRSHPTDPEGFGMVAIEAAAHGLGTVAYASGGVADAVADGLSGALVEPGDSIGFARAVVRAIGAPLPAAPMQAFATGFGWDAFGRQIRDVLGLASNHEQ
ncbi:Glycogen synthase [compost metagenome]